MSDERTDAEWTLLRGAADRAPEGYPFGQGYVAAARKLTEEGLGHWEQTSPFVPSFFIADAGLRVVEWLEVDG